MATLVLVLIFCCQIIFAQNERGIGNVKNERKIALVIGNTNYDNSIGRLTNPVNDARDMAESLKRLGFTLVGGKPQMDVNRKQMLQLIRDFGQQIKQGGIGFFYFSGHGVQVNKENYIIPITDALVYEDDAETEAVKVDMVAKEMELAGNRLNILVLDACRNNGLQKRTRNTDKGLTEPNRKPEGTFIAFSAGDGQTASDGTGKNGLFTQELLKNLETPNVRLDDIFRTTRNEVKRLSDGKQIPVLFDSTSVAFVLKKHNSPTPAEMAWNNFRGLAKSLLKYDFVGEASEDFIIYRLKEKWGFIDKTGEIKIPAKFDFAESFSENLAVVGMIPGASDEDGVKSLSYGYINKLGATVIPIKYLYAFNFSQGLAGVVNNKEMLYYIDKNNKTVFQSRYPFYLVTGLPHCLDASEFRNDLAPVAKAITVKESGEDILTGCKYGFINKLGKEIIPFDYDLVDNFSEGLARVEKDGKFGFIDEQERIKIPLQFSIATSFSDGIAIVKKDNKWHLIGNEGNIIVTLSVNYSSIEEYSNNLAEVKIGSYEEAKIGFIDKKGKEPIPVKYEDIWCYAFIKEGFIGVKLNGKKGFVDLYGNEYFDF